MKLKAIHKDCGGEIIFTGHNNGACGDPGCCGEYIEYVQAKCLTCKKIFEVEQPDKEGKEVTWRPIKQILEIENLPKVSFKIKKGEK